jgi:hypothetical protein
MNTEAKAMNTTGILELLYKVAPLIPDGVTDMTDHLTLRSRVADLLDEHERLRKALQEIERFGHNEGHGRGYTCANMAADALEQKP